jgi:hypothetical protein
MMPVPDLRKSFVIMVAVFVALCVVYAGATPPFEASDELWHFGLVNHLADTRDLPVQQPGIPTPWEQEGSQPPLYYLLAGMLVSPLERGAVEDAFARNPHAMIGIPGNVGNKNHTIRDEAFPDSQGTITALYLARAFSIALGVVTVTAVYLAAGVIAGDRRALPLIAAGITAFNPMFLFITASVNNDNLVTALNSLTIWLLLVMMRDGFDLRRSLLIGALVALATLSKLSGLVLVPAAALAGLWTAYRHQDWRGLFTLGALMAGIWLLLAGWWYWRNLTLYGELFGTQTMVAVAGAREGPFTLATMLAEFQGFRFAYWALFGLVNIITFRWFYDVMDIFTLLALAGLLVYLWRRRGDRAALVPALLLALTALVAAGSVIFWTAQTYASQGRLLFPFVAASSTLLALGVTELLRLARLGWSGRWGLLPVAGMGIFALIVPVMTIMPAYRPPEPAAALPDGITPVYARFGEVELLGYETPRRRYQPGDTMPVTVYWRALERSSRDLSLYLHAVTNNGTVAGKVDSYPGAGLLRTTTWQPGVIYADHYGIALLGDNTAQNPEENELVSASKLRIQAGWWDYATGDGIPAMDENGMELGTVMLDAGAIGERELIQEPDEPVTPAEGVVFGGIIELAGYRLDGDRLLLVWEMLGTTGGRYTVFAQVLDAENRVIGQGDAPPVMPTRYWLPGERFITEHVIVYPELPEDGEYVLIVGWYDPEDFSRLETDTPDNAYRLLDLTFIEGQPAP